MEGLDLFGKLPEGCISHIISFTSPRDACRSSAVCSIFRSGSESDSVWERFLPPDYQDVLAGSVSPPVRFSSKKELFFRLCDPVLIDEGRMVNIHSSVPKTCYKGNIGIRVFLFYFIYLLFDESIHMRSS